MKRNYGVWYTLPLSLWVSFFFVVPIGIILVYSVLTQDVRGGGVLWQLSGDGYSAMAQESFVKVTAVTFLIAILSTVITILIAVPAAYYMVRKKSNVYLLLLVILPFWVNFMIRVFAWMSVEGFLGDVVKFLGISQDGVQILFNMWAVVLINVYIYLPYAVLPLYSAIEKFDFQLLEAARDLGANHSQSLWRVMMPNIRPGVVTAILFTFIPTIGSYAVPALVGGTSGYMLGNSIAYAIEKGNNWPRASAIAVVLTVITSLGLLVYFLVNRSGNKQVVAEEESE